MGISPTLIEKKISLYFLNQVISADQLSYKIVSDLNDAEE
jgi:hypothetical protein